MQHNISEDVDWLKYNFSDSSVIWWRIPTWELSVKILAFVPGFVVALCGNVSIILVMVMMKGMRSCTNLFILNMAVANLMTTLACTWMFLVSESFQNFVLGPLLCRLTGPFNVTFMLSSGFSLMVISFDRLLGIAWPFSKRLTKTTSKAVIVVIWVSAIAAASPLYIYRTYKKRQWADFLETFCKEDMAEMAKVYWTVILVLLFYLPLTVVTMAYTVILLRLEHYEQKIAQTTSPKKVIYRRKVIRMLFLYLLCLFICWFLFQVVILHRHFVLDMQEGKELPGWHQHVFFVAHLLAFANSAINPILYGACNANFRKAFRKLRQGGTRSVPTASGAASPGFQLSAPPIFNTRINHQEIERAPVTR